MKNDLTDVLADVHQLHNLEVPGYTTPVEFCFSCRLLREHDMRKARAVDEIRRRQQLKERAKLALDRKLFSDPRRVRNRNRAEGRALGAWVAALIRYPDRQDILGEFRCEYSNFKRMHLFRIIARKIPEKVPHVVALVAQDLKFVADEWKFPPWENEGWALDSWQFWAHAPHVSEVDPTMVAFNESNAKLVKNVQTRMKPGKYLKRFYPHLSDEAVREWSHKFDKLGRKNQLEFIGNDDPCGWVEAYRYAVQASDSGYTSCMHGENCVEVYACPGNGLRLAVLRNDNGDVIARAIVKGDEYFVRAYTNRDEISANTFIQILESNGFTQDFDMAGVKLRYIERGNSFVCPYIDGDTDTADVCGDYVLIRSDGEYVVKNTGGRASRNEPEYCCDICGDECDEDDLYYVECDDRRICQSCCEDNYVYAYGRRGNQGDYRREDCVRCRTDGEWYVEAYANSNGVYECAYTNDWYDESDLVSTMDGLVNSDDAVKLDHEDSEGNEYACPGNEATLSDGTVCHEDDKERLQAEIDEREAVGDDFQEEAPLEQAA